jgi:hypothetical protein
VQATHYRFVVSGRVDPDDLADFEVLTARYADATTTLSGVVPDSETLVAILVRLIDLDLIILGLQADGPTDEPEVVRPG